MKKLSFPLLQHQLTEQMLQSDAGVQRLEQCWQQFSRTELRGRDGVRFVLYSRTQLPQWRKASAALLIVPGRIEAAHKYAELAEDALCAGYQVFVLDHRGQGLAERHPRASQVGFVADFDHYVQDLSLAVATIRSQTSLPLLALAHSMGGAILYRYLQTSQPSFIDAAVCCSPMFGIPLGPLPALVPPLATMMWQLNRWLSDRPWYVPGQGPYTDKVFAGNDLTCSEVRYQWFRQLYRQQPDYQLGGVSWAWLAAALRACQQIRQQPAPLQPCLLLQAADETVVDNQAQNFVANRSGNSLISIAGARHELFAAPDPQRQQVYAAINQWLDSLSR